MLEIEGRFMLRLLYLVICIAGQETIQAPAICRPTVFHGPVYLGLSLEFSYFVFPPNILKFSLAKMLCFLMSIRSSLYELQFNYKDTKATITYDENRGRIPKWGIATWVPSCRGPIMAGYALLRTSQLYWVNLLLVSDNQYLDFYMHDALKVEYKFIYVHRNL